MTSREDPRVAQALAECTRLTAASGSNFYLAFLPLPEPRRLGMFCVYAFCRVVDDLVDECLPGEDPRPELERWRRRVRDVVAGRLAPGEHPVALGLAWTHERFPLGEEDLLALIDGMQMDLEGRRYGTAADLALYCERVAGRVGCLCLPIFGCTEPGSRPYALTLGHAFQLTNIVRDVGRDAQDGRLYLPLEHLERHGVRERDVLAQRMTPALRRLLREEGERALGLFLEAEALLPPRDRRHLFPASIMAAIYRRLLERLRASDYDVFGERASLPAGAKLLLAGGVLLRDRVLGAW